MNIKKRISIFIAIIFFLALNPGNSQVAQKLLELKPLPAQAQEGDPTVAFTLAEQSVGEDAGVVTLTVALSDTSTSEISIPFSLSGSATGGGTDYSSSASPLVIPADTASGDITITIVDDSLYETSETVIVTLEEPATGATLGATFTHTLTINDNDALPVLTINDYEGNEGTSSNTSATFTVTLTPVSGATASVDYATADGSATQPDDYTSKSDTLTFAPGEITKQINVEIIGDTTIEDDETFTVTLSSPEGADIGTGTGTGTILNDDLPVLSIDSPSISEGNSGTKDLTFTVTLLPASADTVTVDYATADGTATQPSDYTAKSDTLTFAPGETTKEIDVEIIGDTTIEPDETFTVTLSSPNGATIGTATGTGTILNDDFPVLSIDSPSISEGNSGTKNLTFTVTLSPASTESVTVEYATADGTATQPSDYIATSDTLSFAPGETTKEILIAIKGDVIYEPDETFTVTLSNPDGATIGTGTGTGTIENDEDTPALSISGASVSEGNSGTVDAIFTVTLDPASYEPVTVQYATSNGTAIQPGDYTATEGTLTFNPEETSKEIKVPVIGDWIDEADETFTVTLSNPNPGTRANIETGTATGTILDDDTAGFTVSPTENLQTSESGGTDTFTIVLNSQPTGDVTIPLSSSNTSEGTVSPSSVTFSDENWNVPQTVMVIGVDDQIQDGAQDYKIITGASSSTDPNYNGKTVPDVSVVNADNDTAGITLTPTSGLVTKESGLQDTLKIILNTKPTANVTVNISSSDVSEGVVSADSHVFTAENWNETFTVTITGIDDTIEDGDVNYKINLSTNSSDPNYDDLDLSVSAVNRNVPTIDWIKPVKTEEIYEFDGLGPLRLMVTNAGEEEFEQVRFYWWDDRNLKHVTIAMVTADSKNEFKTTIDTATLYPGWNQLFADAYDADGNVSRRVRILLFRLDGAVYRQYLPEVAKNR
jgi:hypothetical protein